MIAAAGEPDIFQNALFDAVGSLFVVALTEPLMGVDVSGLGRAMTLLGGPAALLG